MVVPNLERPVQLPRINVVHSQGRLEHTAIEVSSCLDPAVPHRSVMTHRPVQLNAMSNCSVYRMPHLYSSNSCSDIRGCNPGHPVRSAGYAVDFLPRCNSITYPVNGARRVSSMINPPRDVPHLLYHQRSSQPVTQIGARR